MNGELMKVPTQAELTHLQLQAMLRENSFPEDELKYLGERDGEHYYLIAGEHEVPVSAIEELDQVDTE
jgi:hypothetical protein|tara:strand:- start:289 stop:492 length:204 start_codon:yes stop_codon:yes gene_type:complete